MSYQMLSIRLKAKNLLEKMVFQQNSSLPSKSVSFILFLKFGEKQLDSKPFCSYEGLIKLIHKKEEKDIISNWRSITLLNCAYKIYAKAVVLKLRYHMKEWVRQEQKGIIKGQFIMDNIVTVWEAMEYAKESGQD